MTQNKAQEALDLVSNKDYTMTFLSKDGSENIMPSVQDEETILAALKMYRIVYSGELEKEEQKIFGEKIEEPEPWMDDYSVFESAELLGFQRGNNAVLHKLKEIK